jgi:hypothetical protein
MEIRGSGVTVSNTIARATRFPKGLDVCPGYIKLNTPTICRPRGLFGNQPDKTAAGL